MRLTIGRALPYNRATLVKAHNKKRSAAEQVSELTTNRLSIYLRCLDHLAAGGDADRVVAVAGRPVPVERRSDSEGPGVVRANSAFAASATRLPAWLPTSGRFSASGIRSTWRSSARATSARRWPTTRSSRATGSCPVALFDRASSKVGTTSRGGVPIYHIRRLPAIVRKEAVRIAMIAVPAPAAQLVASLAVAAGLEAILQLRPGTGDRARGREGEERRPGHLARGAGLPPRERVPWPDEVGRPCGGCLMSTTAAASAWST